MGTVKRTYPTKKMKSDPRDLSDGSCDEDEDEVLYYEPPPNWLQDTKASYSSYGRDTGARTRDTGADARDTGANARDMGTNRKDTKAQDANTRRADSKLRSDSRNTNAKRSKAPIVNSNYTGVNTRQTLNLIDTSLRTDGHQLYQQNAERASTKEHHTRDNQSTVSQCDIHRHYIMLRWV
jgi:hypothetical protein